MRSALFILGFIMMAGGLVGLVLGRAIVSAAPSVIACQVLAVGLMIWARMTFGRRSFHKPRNEPKVKPYWPTFSIFNPHRDPMAGSNLRAVSRSTPGFSRLFAAGFV